jgi:hypothetical protein
MSAFGGKADIIETFPDVCFPYSDINELPVCTENSNSDIMVMQSAKDRVGMDTSSSLNWARERRVLI